MRTTYEAVRVLARPVLPVLESIIARDLAALLAAERTSFRLLDVGGRSSPYTCGLDARITIMELARESDVQMDLHLGVESRILENLDRRRSNIHQVLIQDLVENTLPDASFDGITAIEVLEHVAEDRRFIEQCRRLLAPGGWLYLTTPNGDYIKNEPPNFNPDHVRHYTRQGLDELLRSSFEEANVRYAVSTGKYRYRGLRSFEKRRPLRTLGAMASNLINHLESRNLDERERRTAHLVAIAH